MSRFLECNTYVFEFECRNVRLDEDMAFQYVMQITEAVESVGGVLTLLWHPNAMINPLWWNLYRRSLEYLKEKNAWFGSVRELAQHIKPQLTG